MMNYTKSIIGNALYSVCMAVKLRHSTCIPIALMHFPCIELNGMIINAANSEACRLLGENPVGRPFVALLDVGARRIWRREAARRGASPAEYLGETNLECRKGGVRVRLVLLRGRQKNTLLLSPLNRAACSGGLPDRTSGGEGEVYAMACRDTAAFAIAGSDALADLAHELRAPLTIIKSAAALLRERPENSRKYLNSIERSCLRLQGLINDILAVNGTGTGAEESVELISWLGRFIADMEPQAEFAGVKLILKTDVPELSINTQSGGLEHILLNVVNNALKFTPRGGSITIALAPKAGHAEISVCDTGCGIPPEKLTAIFERGCTAGGKGGSGLGLALAARYAAALGGELRAQSDGAHGSAFILTLPLN